MDIFSNMTDWISAHPQQALAGFVIVVVLYAMARRKPKIFREAERDFDRLREERGRPYDETRSP